MTPTSSSKLVELRKKALEAALSTSEEEKKLVKDLVESSFRMIYLGYVPAYYRYTYQTQRTEGQKQ